MRRPNKVILIRHARAENNDTEEEAKNRDPAYSTFKCELTDLGKEQARITGEWMRRHFPTHTIHAFYVSNYVRSQQTLQTLYPDATPHISPLIGNLRRGISPILFGTQSDPNVPHLLTDTEVQKLSAWEKIRKEAEGPYHHRPLNGESLDDMEMRLTMFDIHLQLQHADETVISVMHGKSISVQTLRVFEGCSIEEYFARRKENRPDNASVTIYRKMLVDGKEVLRCQPDEYNIVPWKGLLAVPEKRT